MPLLLLIACIYKIWADDTENKVSAPLFFIELYHKLLHM